MWAGLGSADASTTHPSIHGWPASARSESAATTITSTKAAAAAGSQTLLLVAHQVRHANVDINNDGFGPGDFFLFEENLRYANGGTQVVGRDSVRCTAGITTFICDGTILLYGKGKITVYAARFGPHDDDIDITGGTGNFENIGGQLDTGNAAGRGNTLLAFEITR